MEKTVEELFLDFTICLPPGLLKQMKRQKQRSDYHPEGNVFNHTRLVFQFIYEQYDKYFFNNEIILNSLFIASIFHDMGKLMTTFLNKEEILVSYNHSIVSLHYLDQYLHLYDNSFSYNKELIYFLVKNHTKAHYFFEMKKSKKEELQKTGFLEYLLFFQKADVLSKKIVFIQNKTVIFLCGIPGSGKTTYATNFLLKKNKVIILSSDDIRKELTGSINNQNYNNEVFEILTERLYNFSRDESNQYDYIIVDTTNTLAKNRNKDLKLLPVTCKTELHILLCEKETARTRIQKDLEEGKDRSNAPDYVINKMYDNYFIDSEYLKYEIFDEIKYYTAEDIKKDIIKAK